MENKFRSESAWSRAARGAFGALACWERRASREIGCVVGLVTEDEGGKEDVEDEACGREELELDDEWRSRMRLLSKDELRGELMVTAAGDCISTLNGRK